MAQSAAGRHTGVLGNRRAFFKMGGRAVASMGTAAAVGQLGLMNSFAQSSGSDYKALVCLFMFGGNDANDTLIPTSDAGYTQYVGIRKTAAIARDQVLGAAVQGNQTFGLHPSLGGSEVCFKRGRRLRWLMWGC